MNRYALVHQRGSETLRVEPWARNSVRVRVALGRLDEDGLGMLLPRRARPAEQQVERCRGRLVIDGLTVELGVDGLLRFSRTSDGEVVLAEEPIRLAWREARTFTANGQGACRIVQQFCAYPGEQLLGLGPRDHGRLDRKGVVVDLGRSGTEVSIPFLVSSRGYGFLWNNPAVGHVELGWTGTRWVADSASQIDYWLTIGSPAEIATQYADATGHAWYRTDNSGWYRPESNPPVTPAPTPRTPPHTRRARWRSLRSAELHRSAP